MNFTKRYIKNSVEILKRLLPQEDESKLEAYVKSQIKKNMIDPEVTINNNVTGFNKQTTLLDVIEYIREKKPVVGGNATLYLQPSELTSPTSVMLRSLKSERSAVKKEMFKLDPVVNKDEYDALDLSQGNIKVISNAEYGGSGTPTAAFYSKWSPPATTLMAQSIITTMANLFESIIGDNNKFMSIQECFDWMLFVINKPNVHDELPKWIVIPSRENLKRRIKIHFYMYNIEHSKVIDEFIDSLNDNEVVYLYYAHNLHEFVRNHDRIRKSFYEILSSLPVSEPIVKNIPEELKGQFKDLKSYNEHLQRSIFMDPYHPPKTISKQLESISKPIMEYCHVSYLTPDSIEKLNHHKRKTVLLVDTDSNVLYLDPFVQFIKSEILHGETLGRDDMLNDIIIVNITANFLDPLVADILDLYGRKHNMDNDSRAELKMKNEFLFRKLMLLTAKKSYLASIVLREGNLFFPFKTEIKGVQFIKSAVSEGVSKRFTSICEKNILFSPKVQLRELMRDVKIFEREIIEDLKSGGTQYLKSQQLKQSSGYKDPWRIQIYKAVNVWNTLYPLDILYPMDRAFIVKLGITSPLDLDKIKDKYPEEYKMVMEKIFNSPDKNVVNSGFSVIGVPFTHKKVPEWIVELMDIELLCADVMGSFRMIMDAFKIEYISVSTPSKRSKKVEKFTNFIRF